MGRRMTNDKRQTPYIFVAVVVAALIADGVLIVREKRALEKAPYFENVAPAPDYIKIP